MAGRLSEANPEEEAELSRGPAANSARQGLWPQLGCMSRKSRSIKKQGLDSVPVIMSSGRRI